MTDKTLVTGLLTPEEHRLMSLTAQLARGLFALCGDASDDKAEVAHEIHALQYRILAQAAARAYPERYRGMGPWVEGELHGEGQAE